MSANPVALSRTVCKTRSKKGSELTGLNGIELIETIGSQPMTEKDLSEQFSATRSEINRILAEFEEGDLVRKEGFDYHLTPVGELIQTEVTQTAESIGDGELHAGLKAIEYLLKTGNQSRINRVRVLRLLAETPQDKATLVSENDLSESTVYRTVREFTERGWVTREDGDHTLTERGEAVNEALDHFLSRCEIILDPDMRFFLLRFGNRSTELPLDGLATAEVIKGSHKQDVLNAAKRASSLDEVYAGSETLERIDSLIPFFSETMLDEFKPLVGFGTNIRTIDDLEMIEGMTQYENLHYLPLALIPPNVETVVFPEDLTFGLGRYDDTVLIAAFGQHYPNAAAVISTDERVLRWVEQKFEELWTESVPLVDYLGENLKNEFKRRVLDSVESEERKRG